MKESAGYPCTIVSCGGSGSFGYGNAGGPEADTRHSRCSTADGTALTAATIRRLACDAGVIPIVLGSDGDVLDVGRRTRTVPRALRNALVIRHAGCTFPGCDLSPSWCDGHHLHHWSDGGPTNLANLALLCSTHHHIVHEDRWSLTRAPDDTLDFTTPTGSKLEARVGNSREDPP